MCILCCGSCTLTDYRTTFRYIWEKELLCNVEYEAMQKERLLNDPEKKSSKNKTSKSNLPVVAFGDDDDLGDI